MIHITDEQKKVPIPASKVRRLAAQILGEKSLSVAFVTNAAIRKINRKFLNHDFATDVISFPLGTDLVGELVISAEYAAAEAAARKIRWRRSFCATWPTGSSTCSGTTTTGRRTRKGCGRGRSGSSVGS
jgi:ssRNA-specific RNase YbeY (16S rRNA maturation enzyme)